MITKDELQFVILYWILVSIVFEPDKMSDRYKFWFAIIAIVLCDTLFRLKEVASHVYL